MPLHIRYSVWLSKYNDTRIGIELVDRLKMLQGDTTNSELVTVLSCKQTYNDGCMPVLSIIFQHNSVIKCPTCIYNHLDLKSRNDLHAIFKHEDSCYSVTLHNGRTDLRAISLFTRYCKFRVKMKEESGLQPQNEVQLNRHIIYEWS